MAYGELTIQPEHKRINSINGQFMKGHIPANKGKKWDEFMSKKSQKRAAIGWKNLTVHRPKKRSDVAGRCRKPIIAVMDDGRWLWLPYIGAAAQWCKGNRENVGRCCRENRRRRVKKRSWGGSPFKGEKGYTKSSGSLVNTDHYYKGIRFYFESDNIWTTKIRNK